MVVPTTHAKYDERITQEASWNACPHDHALPKFLADEQSFLAAFTQNKTTNVAGLPERKLFNELAGDTLPDDPKGGGITAFTSRWNSRAKGKMNGIYPKTEETLHDYYEGEWKRRHNRRVMREKGGKELTRMAKLLGAKRTLDTTTEEALPAPSTIPSVAKQPPPSARFLQPVRPQEHVSRRGPFGTTATGRPPGAKDTRERKPRRCKNDLCFNASCKGRTNRALCESPWFDMVSVPPRNLSETPLGKKLRRQPIMSSLPYTGTSPEAGINV